MTNCVYCHEIQNFTVLNELVTSTVLPHIYLSATKDKETWAVTTDEGNELFLSSI